MDELGEAKKEVVRIPTYVENLDQEIQGGIPEGHVTLISGTSGTMKSSLSFNILFNEVVNGKTAIYLSLEQSAQSLLKSMIALGFDMSKINLLIMSDIAKIDEAMMKAEETKGALIVSDMGAMRKELKNFKNINPDSDWINVIKNLVNKIVDCKHCNLFALDSLSALYAVSEFKNPRNKLFYFFEFLRDSSVTAYLISEIPPSSDRYSEYGVEDYLSDAIIHLAMARDGRKVRRELNIVKMRSTKCNMDVFILDYEKNKFRALSKIMG